ncbi:TonB-dependent receptor [Phenylobacterium sp.]|uniref:TonB-dependent receptor n=1 Tax=Phenylobacterium sp. TaxID=1871053 RepID=UPI001212A492|nr:TonB-dependent receptor [Phenylobacterium sp.]THD61558.1 MAG: TonB-dependent receptor [Phenylobacterium sp.]
MQANVSLLGASACGAGGQTALSGRYPLSEALTRVLAGAPCTFRIVDARTVRISALPAAPAAVVVGKAPAQPVVDELMVTARKRPEREDSLPAGVSVISADQLFATNAYDVRDTAGQLVGVLTTNLGPGRDKLLMRGLSDGAFTGRARSTVSTYLDDAPINYNAPDPDLRLTDVAQIETVRGPQGALYGNGALAGVYRIVTNKPDPDHYTAGAEASYATTQGGSPSYSGEGYANLPLADGRAALRLVAYYDDEGGYLDDVSLRLSNVDSTIRTGGRAALRLELDSDWTLDVALIGQRLSSRDTQYTTLTTLTQRANQVREASDNNFAQAQVTLHGELGWADLSASTSYVQNAYDNLYDATAVAAVFAADSALTDNGVSVGVYSEGARIRRLVQDVVLTSTGAGAFSWLAGAYGSLSVERTPSSLDILPNPGQPIVATTSLTAPSLQIATLQASGGEMAPPAPGGLEDVQSALIRVYNENRRDNLSEAALYGEGTWRFAPGWSASAGTRISETNLDVKAAIVGAPPAQSRDIDESRSFSAVTSKLSAQYQFDDEGPLVYALYSEGFRPGGVNSTGFLPIRPSRATFDPDRLMNYELGAKGQFLDKRLILRAAAFFDIWTNIQSDQYRPSGLAYTANVGDAHIQGMEAEAAYAWDFGLSLQANALYSAPKFTRTNPDFAGQLGSGLPGAPRWSGGLVANYVRPLPYGDLKFHLVGRANYTGPARLTFDPTLSSRTDPVVDAEILAEIDSRRWRAGLFVSNPADTAGDTFAYGNPFTFGQVRQVTPQRPRTVGVRLATAF